MNFLNNLPINWFDAVLIVFIFVGIQRGRKRGMSEELLPVLKWLGILFGASKLYQPLGKMIAQDSVFSLLSSYVIGYLSAALLIAITFAIVKKMLGGKLVGSDIFGRSEYYLGMVAGTTRFLCMLLVGLALLNARNYSAAEVQANFAYQKEVYGSDFFPGFQELQSQVFQASASGKWIKGNLSTLLIEPTRPEKKEVQRKQLDLP